MVFLRELIKEETPPEEMELLLKRPFEIEVEDIGVIFANGHHYSEQFKPAKLETEEWFRKHYDYSPESTIFLSYLYHMLTPRKDTKNPNPLQIYRAHIALIRRYRREGRNVDPSTIYKGDKTFRQGLEETAREIEKNFHFVDQGIPLAVESAVLRATRQVNQRVSRFIELERDNSLKPHGFYMRGEHRLKEGMMFRA